MKKMFLTVLTVGIAFGDPVQAQAQQGAKSEKPGMMSMPMAECSMQDMMQMMHGQKGLRALSGAAFDRAFVMGMIEHHQEVIERSQTFAGNAKDARVKGWAAGILKAQQAELEALSALAKQFDQAEQPGMSMGMNMSGMMGEKGMMGGHSKEMGQEVDPERAYVMYVVTHHAAALQMASEALTKSEDARILQLARQVLVDQSREILEMKAWLKRS